VIEAGHKEISFFNFVNKNNELYRQDIFKRNICPIISGLGNMKGLDIRRRDGNGWWEAQGVEAGSMAQGRLRRIRYRLVGFWCIARPQSNLLVINFLK
jgi:hypothetical protein